MCIRDSLQAMESDSDIEAIADAVISASVLRDECDGNAASVSYTHLAPFCSDRFWTCRAAMLLYVRPSLSWIEQLHSKQ